MKRTAAVRRLCVGETMSDIAVKKRYSTEEEIASAITHGIGTGLSTAALVLMIVRAVRYAPAGYTASYVTGFAIFGSCLIILYISSTLYHALTNPKAKKVFSILDHSSIYLLIAGTYTAYCLTVLHGAVGWTIFGIIWGLAAAGITFYSVFGNKMRALSVVTYILMGWIIIFAAQPMKANLNNISWNLLLAGGLCYTAGTIVYALKKIKWPHAIWHLFVLAGSTLHFFSVYLSI